MRLPIAFAATSFAMALIGCDAVPRDPDSTTARLIAGEPVRAGLVGSSPNAAPARSLVERVGVSLGTRTQWQVGESEALLRNLEDGHLDVVVGEFGKKSPWMKRVSFSRTVGGAEPSDPNEPALRLARRNGENRWILLLDRAFAP